MLGADFGSFSIDVWRLSLNNVVGIKVRTVVSFIVMYHMTCCFDSKPNAKVELNCQNLVRLHERNVARVTGRFTIK